MEPAFAVVVGRRDIAALVMQFVDIIARGDNLQGRLKAVEKQTRRPSEASITEPDRQTETQKC